MKKSEWSCDCQNSLFSPWDMKRVQPGHVEICLTCGARRPDPSQIPNLLFGRIPVEVVDGSEMLNRRLRELKERADAKPR